MSAPQPLTGDELATIKARAQADQCGGLWLDHAEPVCGVHGFYWPEDSEWCNRVEPAARETLRLVAEIERLRAER